MAKELLLFTALSYTSSTPQSCLHNITDLPIASQLLLQHHPHRGPRQTNPAVLPPQTQVGLFFPTLVSLPVVQLPGQQFLTQALQYVTSSPPRDEGEGCLSVCSNRPHLPRLKPQHLLSQHRKRTELSFTLSIQCVLGSLFLAQHGIQSS